ncbi:hypothetical protein PIB30_003745 [Stylosanthes scabra]|uniref:Uncharacterized protein n=1 Tax=Stylosanthes scabra TaxID=79078 RepID=A0ABU6R3Z3_9FABA|nr:hypothetical protein [Stylosanthes scabra]
MLDVRGGGLQRLKWLSDQLRRQLLHRFATDPGFLKRSSVNKVNRGSSKGGCLHTGGSATIPKTRTRMTRSLDRPQTEPELFRETHTRKWDRSIMENAPIPSFLPTSSKPPKRRRKRVMTLLAQLIRTRCGVKLCQSRVGTGYIGSEDSSPRLFTDLALEGASPEPDVEPSDSGADTASAHSRASQSEGYPSRARCACRGAVTAHGGDVVADGGLLRSATPWDQRYCGGLGSSTAPPLPPRPPPRRPNHPPYDNNDDHEDA